LLQVAQLTGEEKESGTQNKLSQVAQLTGKEHGKEGSLIKKKGPSIIEKKRT